MQIVRVPFHGDEVQALQQGEDVWLPLKPMCERLGVVVDAQRRRLQRQPWACTTVMVAHDASGRNQEMFALHLDCLPMWLATVPATRVRPEARGRLVLYQRECARVLRDHFFGRSASSADVQALTTSVAQLATIVTGLVTTVDHLSRRVNFIEGYISSGGMIPPDRLKQLRRDVRTLAALETAAGRWKSKRAASADIYREMGETTAWGGKGRGYDTLPANLEPAARSVIQRRRQDVERTLLAPHRQQQLALVRETPSKKTTPAS